MLTWSIVLTVLGWALGPSAEQTAATPDWDFNATYIEACSCPMFCQCYFNTKPAGHHGAKGEEHFCRFNMGVRVNRGRYGQTNLTGAKFWLAGDLGGDFSKGQMGWLMVSFDPATSKVQRDGIAAILNVIYPVKWSSVETDVAEVSFQPGKDQAVAKLAGGKKGEVVLARAQGMTNEPVVIRNLKYWGAPRNDGFVLMPNQIEAYRGAKRSFEFRNSNGFMITIDANSKDFAKASKPPKG